MVGTGLAQDADDPTTLGQTIRDENGDNVLETAPGEPYTVREKLGQASPGRAQRRRALLYFAQLTDTHVVDEESPARVEFLDRFGGEFTAAYRPQEGLSPQVLDRMVARVNRARSPLTDRRPQLAISTGDLTDNTQLNETRWFIDLLDGDQQVDPDSGVPGTCGEPKDGRYDGVRDENEYYEPDSSGPPSQNEVDGPGYSPSQAENEAEAGRSSEVRDYPGLFEDMNRPFTATGLRLPWYAVFGNHDSLIQGNQPRNEVFEQIAVGCVRVKGLSSQAAARVRGLHAGTLTRDDLETMARTVRRDTLETLEASPLDTGLAETVPRDPGRRPLKKREFIEEFFHTSGTPDGHGFTRDNLDSEQGNYSFSPRRGVRFVVLDSVNEGGGSNGNIDDPQFRWLHRRLLAADRREELAFVFAHHSLRTMDQEAASMFPPGDQGGNASPIVHFGLGSSGASASPDLELSGAGANMAPCEIKGPEAQPSRDETVRCLFLRHRSVIGFVAGHEHINRITPFERRSDAPKREGGFWEINTASHIDWPQQSRVIDLFDNRDGTLSIFGTVIDHAADPTPAAACGAGDRSVACLASISRELSFNDPQADNGDDGTFDRRGGAGDRNVELVIRDPFANASDGSDGPDGDEPGGEDAPEPTNGDGGTDSGDSSGDSGAGAAQQQVQTTLGGAAGAGAGGDLPFTGLALGALALLGLALVVAGKTLRRGAGE